MTHHFNKTEPKMVRSQSASRHPASDDNCARRKSIAHVGERKQSGPTLQIKNDRRASMRFDVFPSVNSSPSCRSRSLKSPSNQKRLQTTAHSSTVPPPEKPSLCFSLSVPGEDTELHRLRNFCITPKGIVNRGDSFRRKTTSRSCSPKTPTMDGELLQVLDAPSTSDSKGVSICVEDTSAVESVASTSKGDKCIPRYSVWILGLAGVGKTSLKLQFMTSEYICQLDNCKEENTDKYVTIVLDGEEIELEISEFSATDDKDLYERPMPDAFIIVYSVTNRRSYLQAKQFLSYVEPTCGSKAVILVGNKNDLARLRTVSTLEGRSLAKEWGSKFIETSVAINHQVDELLVGIITQIRIRSKDNKRADFLPRSRSNKATGIIKRLWRKTCMTNKSCDNLHSV